MDRAPSSTAQALHPRIVAVRRRARVWGRLGAAGLVTAVLVACWELGRPVAYLGGPRWQVAWRGTVLRSWARALCRLLGMRIRVEGMPPRPPFLLVSNHLSYVDILVFMSQQPCRFISKAEVKTWPVVGWLAATFGTLFIDRASKRDLLRVNEQIAEALARGEGIVFFPEGTSSAGDRVYPFKPGLLALAARQQHPVSYAALCYCTLPGEPPAGDSVCWWGAHTPFAPHLMNLLRLPGFEVRLGFGKDTVQDEDRKALARRLERRVRERFEPTTPPVKTTETTP